jgi:hypothetical protein
MEAQSDVIEEEGQVHDEAEILEDSQGNECENCVALPGRRLGSPAIT